MKKVTVLLIVLLAITLLNTSAYAKSWEGLFDYSKYQNAKISPDGKHLAVSALVDGKMALAFLDRETLKMVGAANFGGKLEVGQYHWVNNERVVIEIAKRLPWQEQLNSYGELFAVNVDGSENEMIYGYNTGGVETGSRIKSKKTTKSWAKIIDVLPEDDKHILISSTPMSYTGERLASVFKLNVYTGVIKNKYGKSPVPNTKFITDASGKLRALVGTNNNNKEQLYIRKNDEWSKVPADIVSENVNPLSISASGKYLYTIDNPKQDLKGIFKLNLDDFSYKSIYTDKKVDISHVEMTTNGRSAYAIRVDDGYPSYLILNKKVEEAEIFKGLLKSFPYSDVSITSKDENGDFYVVKVSSDIDPGNLYLFDKQKNKLTFLFKYKPDFKSAEFSQIEPIQLKASDGKTINGYFTPAKIAEKGVIAPVVILVHGGPHGQISRDYWKFSSKVQYLALNGYSVLQVNYRGTGGYGSNFEAAGYKVWGSKIQQDILEAYQWLVQQKKAIAGNACIMGGSFGAYSAIQSATLYPDSYQCAIGNAGIYDLELMFEEGDVQERSAGLSYLKVVLGTDEKVLRSMSPVNYAEKIKIPLLLAHGEDDERAPVEHVERLKKALDKANKPYEWLVVDKEGHGFYNPENQKAYMKKVVAFLDKHLS